MVHFQLRQSLLDELDIQIFSQILDKIKIRKIGKKAVDPEESDYSDVDLKDLCSKLIDKAKGTKFGQCTVTNCHANCVSASQT